MADNEPTDVYVFSRVACAVAPHTISTHFSSVEIDSLCDKLATKPQQYAVPIRLGHNGPVVGRVECLFRLHMYGYEWMAVIGRLDGNTDAARAFKERNSKRMAMRISSTTFYHASAQNLLYKRLDHVALLTDQPHDPKTSEGEILEYTSDMAALMCHVWSNYYTCNRIPYIHVIYARMMAYSARNIREVGWLQQKLY